MLPLFVISLVNLFVAGPPLKTIVLDSAGPSFGASLPFMKLDVSASSAKFTLIPKDEMTHFFVVTAYTSPSSASPIKLDASVTGKKPRPGEPADKLAVFEPLNRAASGTVDGGYGTAGTGTHEHHGGKPTLQLLQPLLGYTEYDVVIRSLAAGSGKAGGTAAPIPTMEYRLTYVPTPFTYTQIGVRCFFTLTSGLLLLAYSIAMCSVRAPPRPTPAPPSLQPFPRHPTDRARAPSQQRRAREPGQLWMFSLLVLLVALNDPLYVARVYLGGHHGLYVASVFGQILFSGGLFLFWLVYADGMSSDSAPERGCCFYLPKVALVGVYVGVSAAMFIMHGRLPDRIHVGDAHGLYDYREYDAQTMMVIALCASVVAVGVWLSVLVSQAVYRLGWKKVEYIYTEREKSFVGITIVFVILSLCGHLYRAVHGRRGSWMQLQLPFLTLTNSYLLLLTHAFWPSDREAVAPARGDGYEEGGDEYGTDERGGKGQGLLADDDE